MISTIHASMCTEMFHGEVDGRAQGEHYVGRIGTVESSRVDDEHSCNDKNNEKHIERATLETLREWSQVGCWNLSQDKGQDREASLVLYAEKHNSVRSHCEIGCVMRCNGLEYPTLTHQPIDEANESMKGQSSSEQGQSSAWSVPCQSSFFKNLHELWHVGSSPPKQERRSTPPHY